MLKVGAAVMSTGDLLLKNGILFAIDVDDHVLSVLLKLRFELFIFSLAPSISLILVSLGVGLSLLALLVGGSGLVVTNFVQAVHVTFGLLDEVIVVLALKDPLIGSKDALELRNLLVQLVGLLIVIRRKIFFIREELIIIVLAADEFLNLDEMLLQAVLEVLNLRQLQILVLLGLLLATTAEFLGIVVHLLIQLLVVVFLATHVTESERLSLRVDRDDCFLVFRVGTFDLAVVLLLVVDLWQVLLTPVAIHDVTDDQHSEEDQETSTSEYSEEHAPVGGFEDFTHGGAHFEEG